VCFFFFAPTSPPLAPLRVPYALLLMEIELGRMMEFATWIAHCLLQKKNKRVALPKVIRRKCGAQERTHRIEGNQQPATSIVITLEETAG